MPKYYGAKILWDTVSSDLQQNGLETDPLPAEFFLDTDGHLDPQDFSKGTRTQTLSGLTAATFKVSAQSRSIKLTVVRSIARLPRSDSQVRCGQLGSGQELLPQELSDQPMPRHPVHLHRGSVKA
jgi:hypothetical protein